MPGGLRTARHCIFTGRDLYGREQLPRLLPAEAAARRKAGSPSQSMPIGLDSSPKGRAFGSPRKLHLFAKASPFEERLPPAGTDSPRPGRNVTVGDKEGNGCRAATKGGIWQSRQALTERASPLKVSPLSCIYHLFIDNKPHFAVN